MIISVFPQLRMAYNVREMNFALSRWNVHLLSGYSNPRLSPPTAAVSLPSSCRYDNPVEAVFIGRALTLACFPRERSQTITVVRTRRSSQRFLSSPIFPLHFPIRVSRVCMSLPLLCRLIPSSCVSALRSVSPEFDAATPHCVRRSHWLQSRALFEISFRSPE